MDPSRKIPSNIKSLSTKMLQIPWKMIGLNSKLLQYSWNGSFQLQNAAICKEKDPPKKRGEQKKPKTIPDPVRNPDAVPATSATLDQVGS